MRFRLTTLPLLCLVLSADSPGHPPRLSNYAISVTPDGTTASAVSPYGTGYTLTFRVTNNGSSGVSLNFSCDDELTTVICTNVAPSSATISGQGYVDVVVTFDPTGEDGTRRLQLQAEGDAYDAGYYWVPISDARTVPIVSTAPHNGDNIDPGRCVLDCMEAIASYATPAYVSLGTSRAVVLHYRSGQAYPTPTVQFDVTDTSSTPAHTISLRLLRSFGDADWETFANGNKEIYFTRDASGTNRIAAQLDLSSYSTGVYAYWAFVRSRWPSETRLRTLSVHVIVVNEKDSPFGWGWSMPGLQSLYPNNPGTHGVLLTEGDGSAILFAGWCGYTANCSFTSPAGEFSSLSYVHGSGYRRTWPNGTIAWFTAAGYLTSIADRFGNTTAYGYDGSNRLTTITDPAGKVQTLTYGTDGKLDNIQGPDGRDVAVTIDASSNVTSVTQPMGLNPLKGITYDAQHRLTSWQDHRGSTWSIWYDDFSRLDSLRGPAVAVNGSSTDIRQPVSRFLSAERSVIQSNSSSSGTSSNPNAARVAADWRDQATNPRGVATLFTIDRWRAATRIEVAGGTSLSRVSLVTYNTDGLPTRSQDPLGRVARNTWSGHLLTMTVDSTAADTIRTAYNAGKYFAVDSIWGNGAVRVSNTLSSLGLTTSSRLGGSAAVTSTYTYDSRGRLLTATDPEGHVTTSYHAPSGFMNPDSLRAPNGRVTRFAYDAAGRTTRVSIAKDTTWLTYDAINRPTLSIGPLRDSTRTTYHDSIGRTVVVDAIGQTYTFQYDRLGRLEWELDPRSQYLRYGYDLSGNPTWTTNRRNQIVTAAYDTLDRVVRRIAHAENDTTFHAYYGIADSTVAWNSQDRVAIRLDALARPDTVRFTRGSHLHRLTYVYDPTDETLQVVRFHPHSGSERVTTYDYDQFRQLQVTSGDSTYYDDDRLSSAQWLIADESQLRFRHTSDHRLADVSVYSDLGVLDSALTDRVGRRYRLDDVGRVEARYYERDAASAGVDYNYDRAGQLTHEMDVVCNGMSSWSWNDATGYTCTSETAGAERFYSWDLVGNPTYGSAVIGTGNRLVSMNGFSFEYDADGNMTRKHGSGIDRRFVWNSLGQLVMAIDHLAGDTVRYGYGPFGNRIRRTDDAGVVKTFLYDRGNLVAELNSTGAATFVISYFPGIDAPRRIEIGGSSYAYVRERPNNVIALVDASHNVVQSYRYTSFGDSAAWSGSINQPLRYGSREIDEASGLYYHRARWYDPTIGRFITEDPIRIAGGINLYVYAGNNPVNATDPFGTRVRYEYPTSNNFYFHTYDWDWGSAPVPTHNMLMGPEIGGGGGGSGGITNAMFNAAAANPMFGMLCSGGTHCQRAVVVDNWVGQAVNWLIGKGGTEHAITIGSYMFFNYALDPSVPQHVAHFAHEVWHTRQAAEWGLGTYIATGLMLHVGAAIFGFDAYDAGFSGDSNDVFGMEEQGSILQDWWLDPDGGF